MKHLYSRKELADIFLAGLAIQSFSTVIKVKEWDVNMPDDMMSNILKKNVKLR